MEIEDNGKGIAAKDLGNIFERFSTPATTAIDEGRKRHRACIHVEKKSVAKIGGYIWATSKEGEGTCLHFVIRRYREAILMSRILIIEDEMILLRTLKRIIWS